MRTLNRIEEYERRFATALECYIAAVGGMEENAVPVCGDLLGQHQAQLRVLRKRMQADPRPEVLAECRSGLNRELAEYCAKSRAVLARKDGAIKQIIRTLADTASALAEHNEIRSTRLVDFTKRLESIAHIDDLGRIRKELTKEVRELRSFVEAAKGESSAEMRELRAEIHWFRQRLAYAETQASTDALTGVANRAAGERRLEEAIRSGQSACILLLDLDGFKTVNDRYGHQAGDAVLRAFGRRLLAGVRSTDTVFRWGGDEFLVILPCCTMDDALVRAKELSDKCAREYEILHDGRLVRVGVRVSIGTAEHKPGETSDDMFRRADRFLYRQKIGAPAVQESDQLILRR